MIQIDSFLSIRSVITINKSINFAIKNITFMGGGATDGCLMMDGSLCEWNETGSADKYIKRGIHDEGE